MFKRTPALLAIAYNVGGVAGILAAVHLIGLDLTGVVATVTEHGPAVATGVAIAFAVAVLGSALLHDRNLQNT